MKKENSSTNFTKINEIEYLIPLSRRHPLFYVEQCKIVRIQGDIRILTSKIGHEQSYSIPVANIGALLIGPGCSLSSEAARIITTRGCLICFTGGKMSPLFLVSSQHRSPLSRIRQYKFSFNEDLRIKCARVLFNRRKILIEKFKEFNLPNFPSGEIFKDLPSMLSAEAAWAKRAYRKLATDFNIPWSTKEEEDKNKKNPITFLNFLSYSIADIAIYHLGYDPNIGILHGRTKGGGLCYDLADVIKPITALVPSFIARRNEMNLNQIKAKFIAEILHYDIIDFLIKTLEKMFDQCEEKEVNSHARYL